ncbi:hypothetical protein LINGRAHAP2_LOCUS26919 [Linum grandiflorum]
MAVRRPLLLPTDVLHSAGFREMGIVGACF